MVVRFTGDAAAARLVDARYGAFACDQPPDEAPRTEVTLRLRAPDPARRALAEEPFAATARPAGTVLAGAGVRAEIAADLSAARLTAPLGERPVDALLRFLLAARLLERGALLVHASAVVVDGRAWVFAGPSGAGKSTLGRTLRGRLLCDEAVAVCPGPCGAEAHATPYWQARPGHAPIAGLLFPGLGRAPSWEPLSRGRAVARLASCVGPLRPDPTSRVLEVAERLLATVPAAAVTLSCLADIGAWLEPRLAAS